ncbi:hypothetical protein QA648_28295 (plasmid) [Rhizobium sp. CB3171]|uniref:hypothetical protein n=1 Tax=Rhizobium sp. CB3171 TaxID=3039157 RepID=UPI0024B10893|nr:hypothetical protein [Rhizobium sp. CB3171]WFU04670.1 hypothetical protein QA648_28295 [Rhizobium sp. CB3171]
MSGSGIMRTPSSENGAIGRNYAYILIGGFFFPLMIAAHIIARKKRVSTDEIGASHYQLQLRTTSIALIATVVILFVGVAMILGIQHASPLQQAEERIYVINLINASWLFFLWVAARCIRGLYLAGAAKKIQNPKTFWIWP